MAGYIFVSTITYNLFLISIDTDKLKIYYNPSRRVKEGGNITICCSSKRLLPHENLRWLNTGKGKVIQSKMDQTCLVLIDVLHTDDVTFICLANGGTAKRQAMINVICKL